MSIKMKGIYKSFKFITQIFVVKEREMEIGYPTDVKHVAHIGLDGLNAGASTWINEIKSARNNFSATSIGDISDRRDSSSTAITAQTAWSSLDFDQSAGQQADPYEELPQTESPNVPKKVQRKNKRSSSSPKFPSSISRPSPSIKVQELRTMKLEQAPKLAN